jgi:hypothetical protein
MLLGFLLLSGASRMSEDPLNPYGSPSFAEPTAVSISGEKLSPAVLVQQKIVAVLLIIHGFLGIVVGIIYAISAMFMSVIIARGGGWGPDPVDAKTRVTITSGVMAACGLIPGVLQLVAGFMNLWLKGYTTGLIAIGSSLAMVVACYCAPSALILLVYGLVIYLLPTTRRAFALAQQGLDFDTIWADANAGTKSI